MPHDSTIPDLVTPIARYIASPISNLSAHAYVSTHLANTLTKVSRASTCKIDSPAALHDASGATDSDVEMRHSAASSATLCRGRREADSRCMTAACGAYARCVLRGSKLGGLEESDRSVLECGMD